jgi:hypothetical protein
MAMAFIGSPIVEERGAVAATTVRGRMGYVGLTTAEAVERTSARRIKLRTGFPALTSPARRA